MGRDKLLIPPNEKFSFRDRLKSFVYAWSGILFFFKTGQNARIHLAAGVFVSILGFILNINTTEWIIIIFCIALVWISEMCNTTLEKTMDMISPGWHPQVKQIKDLAAASVLIAAIASFIAGCLIFIPKILSL